MTVTVFGYLIFTALSFTIICVHFRLVLISIEKTCETHKLAFDHISKHKYG